MGKHYITHTHTPSLTRSHINKSILAGCCQLRTNRSEREWNPLDLDDDDDGDDVEGNNDDDDDDNNNDDEDDITV